MSNGLDDKGDDCPPSSLCTFLSERERARMAAAANKSSQLLQTMVIKGKGGCNKKRAMHLWISSN